MNAHEILMGLVVASERYGTTAAKALRLHGRRESDRINRKKITAELMKAEKEMRDAEYRALLYVRTYQEIDAEQKKLLNKSN